MAGDMNIERHFSRFDAVTSEQGLTAEISAFAASLGIDQFRFALLIPSSLAKPRAVIFSHCSEAWVAEYASAGLLRIDPIIHLSLRQTRPIYWHSSLPHPRHLPPGAMEVMERASSFGLRNGVSFPLRGPRGEYGILSFVTKDIGTAGLMEASPWLRLAADVIFESAIRVASFGSPGNLALTRREKECLAWASEGKTTAEIAAILGITPRTVTYYIQQVLGKTHSTNRDQAIAKAMAGGVLLPSLDVDVDNVY